MVETQSIQNFCENVPEYYRGKSILITGATGFLAKIIVSKLFQSCPDFKCIYLMIRGKKSQTIEQRMMKQVFDSECIQMVFDKNPKLKQSLMSRVVPVQGDLLLEGLGLKTADRKMLTHSLDIIISSAASVYFHDPVQEALKVNFFGPIKLMELAHQCRKKPAFIHVSTAFVNSNRPVRSEVKEQIYHDSIPGEPDEVVAKIMSWSPTEAAEKQKALIGTFPNTYTFTKHLAEKILMKIRGDLPFAITRPSVVMSSVRDPCPGWIDTIAAAGVVVVTLGNGQKHITRFGIENKLDIIPADYAVNAIILAAPCVSSNPSIPRIFNSSTPVANPITVRDYFAKLMRFAAYNKYEQQARDPWFFPIDDRQAYDVANWFDIYAQLVPLQLIMKIPFLATEQMQALLKQGSKGVKFLDYAYDQLDDFMQKYWDVDSSQLCNLCDTLNKETKEMFPCDARDINWDQAILDYHLGLQKFVFKQDDPILLHGYKQIIKQNQLQWFYSPRLMYQKSYFIKEKSTEELFGKILDNQKFQQYLTLNSESFKTNVSDVTQNTNRIQIDLEQAKKQMRNLSSQVHTKTIIPLFSLMNTIHRRAFDGVFVDQQGLEKVQDLIDNGDKVILMPSYKSFADSFVLSLTFLLHDMDIPFTMGSYEDTPRFQLYDAFLNKMGYILNKRKKGQSFQDNYINSQLLSEIIDKHDIAIVYQNDIRIHTGKFSTPTTGDLSVNWILNAYNQMQTKGKLHIVPICINYDRLLEMKILADEMVTGQNPSLSLAQLMQKLKAFNNHQLGRCTISFLDPINVERYIQNINMGPLTPNNFQQMSQKLTNDLYREQANNAFVTLNMIVSSFLLQEKRSTISIKELTKRCNNLFAYLKANNVATLMTRNPTLISVAQNVVGLGFTVTQSNQNSKDQIVNLDAKNEQRTVLGLAYYSIGLFSHRVVEACLALVIKNHFKTSNEPMSVTECSSQLKHLEQLFKAEYISRDDNHIEQTTIYRIKQLHKFGQIKYDDLNQTIEMRKNPVLLNFFNETFFYLLETYFVVLQTIDSVRTENQRLKIEKLIETIHEALKELHSIQVIKNLHACLDETIHTSLLHFNRMGLCKIETFGNANGTQTSFLSVPEKKKEMIEKQIDSLAQYLSISNENISVVEEEVAKAIEEASIITLAKM